MNYLNPRAVVQARRWGDALRTAELLSPKYKCVVSSILNVREERRWMIWCYDWAEWKDGLYDPIRVGP